MYVKMSETDQAEKILAKLPADLQQLYLKHSRIPHSFVKIHKRLQYNDTALKELIVAETSGQAVLAALVATIVVSCLFYKPSDYRLGNLFNDIVGGVYVVSLAVSLSLCSYCIMMTFVLYLTALKIADSDVIWMILRFKGRLAYETFTLLGMSLICLSVAVGALIYLVNGGYVFSICAVFLFGSFVCLWYYLGRLNSLLAREILDDHWKPIDIPTLVRRNSIAPPYPMLQQVQVQRSSVSSDSLKVDYISDDIASASANRNDDTASPPTGTTTRKKSRIRDNSRISPTLDLK